MFSQPVLHYVENFLGFPVGGGAVGVYDRQAGSGCLPPTDGSCRS